MPPYAVLGLNLQNGADLEGLPMLEIFAVPFLKKFNDFAPFLFGIGIGVSKLLFVDYAGRRPAPDMSTSIAPAKTPEEPAKTIYGCGISTWNAGSFVFSGAIDVDISGAGRRPATPAVQKDVCPAVGPRKVEQAVQVAKAGFNRVN